MTYERRKAHNDEPNKPAPLVVMLHGAGGNAHNALAPLLPLADRHALLLLAPDSRLSTWDALMGGYGPDVRFLDQALSRLFQQYNVDPAHLAIGGFSDGAYSSTGKARDIYFSWKIRFSSSYRAV